MEVASQADWRYFGTPWRSISARTQRTESEADSSSRTGSGWGWFIECTILA